MPNKANKLKLLINNIYLSFYFKNFKNTVSLFRQNKNKFEIFCYLDIKKEKIIINSNSFGNSNILNLSKIYSNKYQKQYKIFYNNKFYLLKINRKKNKNNTDVIHTCEFYVYQYEQKVFLFNLFLLNKDNLINNLIKYYPILKIFYDLSIYKFIKLKLTIESFGIPFFLNNGQLGGWINLQKKCFYLNKENKLKIKITNDCYTEFENYCIFYYNIKGIRTSSIQIHPSNYLNKKLVNLGVKYLIINRRFCNTRNKFIISYYFIYEPSELILKKKELVIEKGEILLFYNKYLKLKCKNNIKINKPNISNYENIIFSAPSKKLFKSEKLKLESK